jgi:RNA-directed DNA polymerase
MLAALETGVRGGVWFSLIDKVWKLATLREAATRVVANRGAAGVDHVDTEEFGDHLEENVERLSAELQAGTYRPQAVRRVNIPKPGSRETRPLGIPTVRDRVVQGAVRLVLEPIFEREFAESSHGFRPKRGCKDALQQVDHLLKEGYVHVVDADLKSYFDSIPHDLLMKRVRERIADGRVLSLVESFLKAGILDGLMEWTPTAGAPQGAVLSPLLSNIYLNPLDHAVAAGGWKMVRYADDFVILCRSAEEAQRALEMVKEWTASAGLTLHPTKTRIVDVRTEGFDFLGYHFRTMRDGRIRRWPREKSLMKLRDAIRAKTRRTSGHSLERIILDVNRTLRGWFEYFKHSVGNTFPSIDQWIRMRLRSILRKRLGKHGRAHALADHLRWRNNFFAEHGLFNLTAAHALARQPCRR